MKQYSRLFISFCILVLSLCILPLFTKAQDLDPVLYDVDTPIDGGVGFLVAAGVLYGIKKIRDERKKKSDNYPDYKISTSKISFQNINAGMLNP